MRGGFGIDLRSLPERRRRRKRRDQPALRLQSDADQRIPPGHRAGRRRRARAAGGVRASIRTRSGRPSTATASACSARSGKATVVDVAYVGSQSRHNRAASTSTSVPYGTTFTAAAQDPTKTNGVVPAVEPGLPAAYAAAGLSFSGANRAGGRLPPPVSGLQRHHLLHVRRRDLVQLAAGVPAAPLLEGSDLRRLLHVVASDHHGLRRGDVHQHLRPAKLTTAAWRRSIARIPRGQLRVEPAAGRQAARRRRCSPAACSTTGRCPASRGWRRETRPSSRWSSPARTPATACSGPTPPATAAGQQPRFYVNGDPQSAPNAINTAAFAAPGDRRQGAVPALRTCAIPASRITICRSSRTSRSAAAASVICSCGSRRSTS